MMGALAALGAAMVWATASIIFAKLGKQRVSPLAMNLVKCTLALVLMSLTLLLQHGRLWPTHAATQALIFLGISGVIGLSIGDTSYFHALKRIGARRTLLLSTLGPVATAVMAWPILGEAITGTMVGGMALTLAGVAWVIAERSPDQAHGAAPKDKTEEDTENESEDAPSRDLAPTQEPIDRQTMLHGLGFACVAVFCQAAGNVLTKLGDDGTLLALELGMVRLSFGIMGLVLVVSMSRKFADVAHPFKNIRQASMLLVAAFLGTYLGIWLLMASLQWTQVAIAATLSATSPLFVLPLAALFTGERITLRAIVGTVVALVGVAILFGFSTTLS